MKSSSVVWDRIRRRAVRVETRAQVHQQLVKLKHAVYVDLSKASGTVPRREFTVRR